jgi:acyl-CoA reductase-like NAD-dependent aldehyde dehydrogenase
MKIYERHYIDGEWIMSSHAASLEVRNAATEELKKGAGSVWSGYEARARRIARRIRAGRIDINGGAFNIQAPFGGYKQSGRGRELGRYGLEEFLEIQSLQLAENP